MNNKDRILLFIPMYNCEKQIVRVLGQIDRTVLEYITGIIVVNNRSTDNGEEAAVNYCREHRELPVKVLRNDENYGLGGSHKVAFEYAVDNGFDYVLVLHGDDQGNIHDFIPLLESKMHHNYDCCLGARFMKNSKLSGYSQIRIWGNYIFNFIFSLAVHRKIKDLGSGLNMYKVNALKNKYFMEYPDTLYFNDVMILSSCYYGQNFIFYPISWREEDQISNNKLFSFSCSLLKMLFNYVFHRKKYMEHDMRTKKIRKYTAKTIWEN